MDSLPDSSQKNLLERILNNKGKIFIVSGVLLRVFMLLFYYYVYSIDPSRSWGDIGHNFNPSGWSIYPVLSVLLLALFRFLSFGIIEIFAFWGFLLDLIIMFEFYFVLKSFTLSKLDRAYGLFFMNPFLFLNNAFSLANIGYHLTDSFFFLFLFGALYFLPKEDNLSKLLFYGLLTLSAAAKLYVLPALAIFLLKFLINKEWKEIKILLISTIPILVVFFVFPLLFWEGYIEFYLGWNAQGEQYFPLIIRIMPAIVILTLFLMFRLKKASMLEILAVAVVVMASFMYFSNPFVRYFQSLIFFGILQYKLYFTKEIDFRLFKREIVFDNHLITFYLSFLGVLIAYISIFTVMQWIP